MTTDKKDLAEKIQELRKIDCYFDYEYAQAIDKIEEILCSSEYKVVVIGEFSAGKSTFINALIGKRLLYSANVEATGAVTTLRSGESAYAEAYDKAGRCLESFSIDSQDGIRKLNGYLQIRGSNSADCVDITYPLEQIEKDIVFLDTPGIEKMSREQTKLTKRAIDDANAVIFLVKKEGFTEPALKILAGEDEDIGKLQTKDIFVVMTRAGEVYHGKSEAEALKKIQELKDEVLHQLTEIGLSGLPVFALDSRDYLWGKDNELYHEVKSGNVEGNILSQDQYIERSKFDEFKQSLMLFLDKDERTKNTLRDVRNRINLLAEVMLQSVQEKSGEQNDLEDKLSRINDNIQLACQNRSRFYKQLKRLLSNYLLDFEGSVIKDIDNQKKKEEQYAQMIEKEIPENAKRLEQKNIDNCLKQVENDNLCFSRKLEEKINEQKHIFAHQYVAKVFAEEFNRFFKEVDIIGSNITLKEYSDLKIDVKQGSANYNAEQDDILAYIEHEMEEAQAVIKRQMGIIEQLQSIERVVEEAEKLRKEVREKEDEKYRELKGLGERPKPQQKYKEIKKTKGHLFWKKTYTDKVPNGLDYTVCQEWDEKYSKLEAYYDNRIEQLEKKIEIFQRKISELERAKGKVSMAKAVLVKKENEKREWKEVIAKQKEKNWKQFVARKKEELYVKCVTLNDNMLDAIKKSIQEYLYSLRLGLMKDIDAKAEKFINEYRKNLLAESQKIGNSIHLIGSRRSDLSLKIKNIIMED